MKLKYYSKVLFNNIIEMETLKIVTDYMEKNCLKI